MSKRRIKGCFKALTDNDDFAANEIAKSVLENDMKWLEDGIVWIGPKT